MAEFSVKSAALEGVALEIQGSQDVKVNGALLEDCLREMITCATRSGCLASGEVRLTDTCVETLLKHNEATNCISQGFGLRVKPVASRLTKTGY
jgi:hypothetical protein